MDDRRTRQIALTDAGREITDRLFELRVGGIRDFVDSLEPEERARLAEVLEPLVGRDQLGVEPPAPATEGSPSA